MTTIGKMLTRVGPGLGRMEGLWKGADFEQVRIRPVRQAEELPRQGLSQIDSIVQDRSV